MNNVLDGFVRPGKRLVSFLMVFAVLALGIGIGTLISYRVDATGPGDSQLKIQSGGSPIAGAAVLQLSQAFGDVAKRVEPAVVNINTEEVVQLRQRRGAPKQSPDEDQEDPMQDFFHRFFPLPNMPEEFTRNSLGSGIIVDPKGYILTNTHVVEGASKIKVSLTGGDTYTAKVIGADSLSDIAVIKIDGDKPFPTATVGDSKAMKVGDWVLAIGSPFGLEQTVTAGIISVAGRVFDANTISSMQMLFNDYLQTDAAINPGNSGGPLVNMNGEVVGINSFISTSTRANAGVGFAVPSHIFVNIYNQILEKGKVLRGWLGVSMNTLPFTPEMAKYFGVKQGSGVLITALTGEDQNPSENTPAAKAGIKPEDVIVGFGSAKIYTVQDLRMAVANTPPGQNVKVAVVRFGKEMSFDATIGERKFESRDQEEGSYSFEEKKEEAKPEIGLNFDNVPARMAQEIGVSGGALILSVKPGSLAEDAGLSGQEPGHVQIVVAANGKKIGTAQDLLDVVRGLKSGEAVILKFLDVRSGQGRVVTSTFYTSIIKP
jgi:serine protease Do